MVQSEEFENSAIRTDVPTSCCRGFVLKAERILRVSPAGFDPYIKSNHLVTKGSSKTILHQVREASSAPFFALVCLTSPPSAKARAERSKGKKWRPQEVKAMARLAPPLPRQ
ncbi:uncharacterized protein J3R85_001584 [Psidium guajava]|nr:uncharacterized protein J3R85_001584 [Psidium guajava]